MKLREIKTMSFQEDIKKPFDSDWICVETFWI